MKILLLGADGQLGYELHRACAPLGEILPFTYSGKLTGRQTCGQVDFEKPGVLDALVREYKPAMVLNAVAHTAVDRAEDEPAIAQRVNADAVGELALACKRENAMLVHYSTDYVFDGRLRRPIREDDATGPVSVYGKTKLAGEQAIRASDCRHVILRTAWVYAARGQNFLRTALKLARERDEIRIVNDQVGSPTPARWLAAATALALARNPDATGTWHVVADGECNWHDFAKAIYGNALVAGVLAKAPKLIGIPSQEFPTKAKRPAYSRLDASAFARDFGLRLPDWRVGLREVIGEIAESQAG
ncbi:MAG: dTDP-4-dehydrorhamnose reductase [Gammaproteobacteria bacterium]|nr:dTDP-4-dehydrorhamnose reductase [Gammaproteobacteria bacterium]